MSSTKKSYNKGVQTTTRTDNRGNQKITRQKYKETIFGKHYGSVLSHETRSKKS